MKENFKKTVVIGVGIKNLKKEMDTTQIVISAGLTLILVLSHNIAFTLGRIKEAKRSRRTSLKAFEQTMGTMAKAQKLVGITDAQLYQVNEIMGDMLDKQKELKRKLDEERK